jgi:putative multiple sugar transport system substrate-binding protein
MIEEILNMMKNKGFLIMSLLLVAAMIVSCAPVATPVPTVAATEAAPAATATATEIPTATSIPPTATATELPTATATVPAAADGAIDVGIILPASNIVIFQQDKTNFRNYLTSLGYHASILYSEGSVDKEKANVDYMIKQGIKVLIICPVSESSAETVEEAKADGIKVILFDRLISNTAAAHFYVSFDNISVGKAQGQYLVDHAVGKGVPLYLYAGSPDDNNSFVFFEGAWSVLQPKIADGTFVIKNSKQAENLQDKASLSNDEIGFIINEITTQWTPDGARKIAKSNLLAVTPGDKGDVAILAPNDNTARTIADTFAADQEVKSFVITGQDGDSLSIIYINSGHQTMTVFKDTRIETKDAIDAALAFLTGQKPVSNGTTNNGVIDIPTRFSDVLVIDKSNVDTYNK